MKLIIGFLNLANIYFIYCQNVTPFQPRENKVIMDYYKDFHREPVMTQRSIHKSKHI